MTDENEQVSRKTGVVSWVLAHPIMTFTVAIAAILIPIIWEQLKTTTSLDLRVVEVVQLVNEETFDSGFTVDYRGDRLNSLARATLLLVNNGTTEISTEKIVKQPTISFPGNVELLTVRVDASDREKLSSEPVKLKGSILLPVALLNPGEDIRINVYADSSIDQLINPTAVARIKYLDQIEVFNLVDQVEAAGVRAAKARKPQLHKRFFEYLFGSVVLAFLTFAYFRNFRLQLKLRNKLLENAQLLDGLSTIDELKDFAKNELPVTSYSAARAHFGSDVERLRAAIKGAISSSKNFYFFVFSFIGCVASLSFAGYSLWPFVQMIYNGY